MDQRGGYNRNVRPAPVKVDREKSCPYLVRVFVKLNSHNDDLDYTITSPPPKAAEYQIYTWKDATIRELVLSLRDTAPTLRTTNRHGSYSVRHVYFDPTREKFHSKPLGSVLVRELLGGGGGGDRGGRTDSRERTLEGSRFVVGDFVDIAYSSGNLPTIASTVPISNGSARGGMGMGIGIMGRGAARGGGAFGAASSRGGSTFDSSAQRGDMGARSADWSAPTPIPAPASKERESAPLNAPTGPKADVATIAGGPASGLPGAWGRGGGDDRDRRGADDRRGGDDRRGSDDRRYSGRGGGGGGMRGGRGGDNYRNDDRNGRNDDDRRNDRGNNGRGGNERVWGAKRDEDRGRDSPPHAQRRRSSRSRSPATRRPSPPPRKRDDEEKGDKHGMDVELKY